MTLQGKGFFIWKIQECENGNPAAILAAAQAAGLSHVLVKIADGIRAFGVSTSGEDDTAPVVRALRGAGIAVWGWHYVYGNDPSREATIAIQRTQALGLDGYVVDAEQEYKQPGKAQAATAFMSSVRSALTCPIALSSYRFPNYHPELPWSAFLAKCDLHMPQVYWEQATNAGAQLRESKRQCDALPNARPYIPTGPAYGVTGWSPSAAQITDFLDTARSLGLSAANFFQWEYCRRYLPQLWTTISSYSWPAPPQPPVPEEPQPPVEEPSEPPVEPPAEQPSEPEPPPAPPGTLPGTIPIVPPDAITAQYLTALNSRQANIAAALYDPHALYIRGKRLLRGKAAIQDDYLDYFASIAAGTSFNLVSAEVDDDFRHLTWKAGKVTGRTTLLLRDGKILLDYTYTG